MANEINPNTLFNWNQNSEFNVNKPKKEVLQKLQQQAQVQTQKVRKPLVGRQNLYLPRFNMVPRRFR